MRSVSFVLFPFAVNLSHIGRSAYLECSEKTDHLEHDSLLRHAGPLLEGKLGSNICLRRTCVRSWSAAHRQATARRRSLRQRAQRLPSLQTLRRLRRRGERRR